MMSPPKILTITREFVKPGKAGTMHDKTEIAFVQAMAHSKWPTHYLGMNSLSEKARSPFFTGYESFEACGKKTRLPLRKTLRSRPDLTGLAIADGELLDSMEAGVFAYNAEYSLNQKAEHATATPRYFEIGVYHVKPGHHKRMA